MLDQSVFSQLNISSNMRPFVALSLIASACAAPSGVLLNGALGHAGLVGAHAIGYAAAPAVAVAPAVAAAPAVSLPAPYATETQAAGVTTYAQPAPVVTKQVHYGQTSYVSGHSTHIHKPPTPFLPISVSPYLRNTESVNAPIVKTETEIHTVNEPVYVERRVEVPYDVPVYKENIIQVPTPVHVDKPYAVPRPVPVQGEPIIKKTVAEPIHTVSHHTNAGVYAHQHTLAEPIHTVSHHTNA